MTKYQTKISKSTEEALTFAGKIIAEGDVVAVPTETVYGLAADATSASAIDRIYEAKNRPKHNPLIVHVGRDCSNLTSLEDKGYIDLSNFSSKALKIAELLIKNFWPGPLTFVLPKGKKLSSTVARNLDTVGFRMPNSPIFLDLIEKSGVPLAAPSANKANSISPTTAEHVFEELNGFIPLILDGGKSSVGIESTIIAINPDGSLNLLRPGGLAVEAIESLVGFAVNRKVSKEKIQAPGMMNLHYAPKKPLFVLSEIPEQIDYCESDLLVIGDFSKHLLEEKYPHSKMTCLPSLDSLVAQKLFEILRKLDHTSSKAIVVFVKQKNQGLWLGILDRLQRASHS